MNLTESDAGTYEVTGANRLGSDTASVVVRIESKYLSRQYITYVHFHS